MKLTLHSFYQYILRKIGRRQLCYAVFCVLLGTLNHFLYDLFGGQAIFALFCPVNESVWEHLKLVFFPFLFVSILYYMKSRPSARPFFYSRYWGTVGGMAATVILFYAYTGVIGRSFLPVDIFIYVISIYISFALSARLNKKLFSSAPAQEVVFSLWIVTACLFFVFTCYPPDIPLFFQFGTGKN